MAVQVNTDLCTGCGRCVEVCQAGAIIIDESVRKAVIDNTLCVKCGECIDRCRKGALSFDPVLLDSREQSNVEGVYSTGRRGSGSSSSWGQGRGRGGGSGGSCGCGSGERPDVKGLCYCPVCNKTMPHKAGVPCSQTICTFCGNPMIRK